jgi:hypothetical protein
MVSCFIDALEIFLKQFIFLSGLMNPNRKYGKLALAKPTTF